MNGFMTNTMEPLTIEAQAANENEYVLNPDEQAVIGNIGAEIQALQQEASAYLKRIARVRNLEGNWSYDASTFKFTKA